MHGEADHHTDTVRHGLSSPSTRTGPRGRLGEHLGGTANLQDSTLKQFLPKGFPGNGCFWISAVSRETAVEFVPLRIGQLKNLRSLRKAVPQVLGELNPLRYR